MAEDIRAWERLGDLLAQRRVELDPRYANRALFARDVGLHYRLTTDIEHALRTNYRRDWLTAIEVGYGWKPGSIRAVLAGGEPELADPRRRALMQAIPRLLGEVEDAGQGDGGGSGSPA